jgi:restriction endonuclease S subunit
MAMLAPVSDNDSRWSATQMLLRDVAEVQVGYTFRSGLGGDPCGAVGVIQMKDLGDDGIVALGSLDRVDMDVPLAQRARVEDIVLRSRGDRATSAIIAGEPGCVLVAAPLLRIRVTEGSLTPVYLNWYINQTPAQEHLRRLAEGTHMKAISKAILEELPVTVPPVERQQAIMRLADLSARQRILSDELSDLLEKLVSTVMMDYAKGSERP